LNGLRDLSHQLEQYSAALEGGLQPARRFSAAPAGGREISRSGAEAPRGLKPTLRWLPAVAAALILTIGISFLLSRRSTPILQQATGEGFIALPYSDVNLSSEGAVVLRVEVPRSALLLAGTPVSAGRRDERVKADVVVGADGLARAIRFVNYE
jgi:hypothetical protein